MGLEAGTFVDDLNVNWPLGPSDTKAQGDDHIRLVKIVLKNTFPGFTGRINRVQSKAGDYTGVLNDNHSTIIFTGVATLSLAAAAVLGTGWTTWIYASGGRVTIDPNAAETVNGAATYVVTKGSMALVICDGASIVVIEIMPASSGFSTGDAKLTMKTVADPGWLIVNDGSIGNAASGATTRANADTLDLFTLAWTVYSNTEVPTQDAAGTPVARGASAAADFAANRRLVLPKALGRAIAIGGAGAGLTARAHGAIAGNETHTLTQAETPLKAHGHSISDPGHAHGANHTHAANSKGNDSTDSGGTVVGGGGTGAAGTGISVIAAGDSTASAHPIVQPTSFAWNAMIKL